ncbi:FAD-dependent oxidoreductase [Luteimonas pelagia]
MRVAVVGSGIAGLSAAWRLSRAGREVVLFEAEGRLGGHVHTHDVRLGGRSFAVDSGFIVFNHANYPLLSALFDELGIGSRPTTMGFSVQREDTGLEYNATTLDRLFCQRRNLASPRFWSMLRDLRRFYREAPALLASADAHAGPTLGAYLEAHGYGAPFRDDHLVPMASALWSAPPRWILDFPARYLVRFLANHRMLQVDGRPEWRVVTGGSRRYVDALRAGWDVDVHAGTPVRGVRRGDDDVEVFTDAGSARFDHVVLACHSDQALALLVDGDEREHAVLGAIGYQRNEAVLHTDKRLLPRHPRAWAAWNAFVPRDRDAPCTVSYCMNLLQGLDAPDPLVVTLNRGAAIAPDRVLATMDYAHPVYDAASVAARARRHEIQGRRRTWFAGAYWGWGFHEDGIRSGYDAADGILAQVTADGTRPAVATDAVAA